MKLSKEKEKEILAAYNVWFNSYANGDIPPLVALLTDDFNQIGSAVDEVFFNKTDAVKFLEDTIDQLAGKTQIRNQTVRVDPMGDAYLVTDLFDIYVLDGEDWSFYSKFRASTLMQKLDGKWKFLHQHSSMPDARTEEGDNLVIERINEENRQLREAVKRRTVELEQKNRELEIEAALERVRSRSMGMQKSEELKEVIQVVYEQLVQLDIFVEHAGFIMDFKKRDDMLIWLADEKGAPAQVTSPYFDSVYWNRFNEAKEKGHGFFAVNLNFDEKNDHYRKLFEFIPELTEEMKDFYFNCPGLAISTVLMDNVCLYAENFSGTPYSDDDNEILKRFGKVFQQTYTRFHDLQKAEEQTREARIEAALERTRTQSMLMQHSSELEEISKIFHEQLLLLNIPSEFSYVWLPDEPNEKHLFWATWEEKNKKSTSLKSRSIVYDLDRTEPYTAACFQAWASPDPVHVSFIAHNEVEHFFNTWSELIAGAENLKAAKFPDGIYYAEAYMKYGCFGINVRKKISGEEQEIIRRFAVEFERTYTRFLDLKRSESQTRESKIEVALERVRARALAMQEPEELKAVADVMRHEMGKLGVEELETSSIYINEESPENAECWYAIKDIRDDQKILVNDYFSLNLNDTWVGREMLKFYKAKDQQVSIRMTGEPRVEWIRYCEERSVPLRGYYGEVIPDRTYHLYKFSHGAIGAATAGDISEENWNLLKRAASVFSLAYSRFKDLTQARTDLIRLKEEKKRAEDALTDLKATQAQLVHAEKMASLGELTAGIAHEIQNPLNFVNNFSEVSTELADELKEELAVGNGQLAKEIVDDIIQNLEKIHHHGKRADGIVKGMLQHSRTTAGEKEPIDINELADEYLRLAYHGMRAKDISFNAEFELDLAEKLPTVKATPQDIGRVLLNLINNAFYAVDQKARQLKDGFKPKVIVTTKLVDKFVEIRVKDNGSGIPENVLKKIFQPFFTTKPTGEGTGLGLSLSYDIITKGHGGELLVQTTEEKGLPAGQAGTTFIIKLPIG